MRCRDGSYSSPVGNESSTSIRSVDNALRAVELLADQGSLRVVDVAEHLGVARSTSHRILTALTERGFLVQDAYKVYRAGPTFERLQSRTPAPRSIVDVVHPHLEALHRVVNETCHLGVLEGSGVRFIDCVQAQHPLQVGTRTGMLLPADRTAIGRALLATLPPQALRALYPRGVTGRSQEAKSSLIALERQVHRARRAGYARNDGESEPGIQAVAVTLADHTGREIAAMAVAIPTARFERSMIPHLVEQLTLTREAVRPEL